MKLPLDISVIVPQLEQTYGKKAPEVLWAALKSILESVEKNHAFSGVIDPLSYEEIVRRHKISGRLNVAVMENARDVLAHLNRVAKKSFRDVDTNLRPIALLLKNYTKEDLIRVIDNKVGEWGDDPYWSKYLRPETLFRPSKFEGYANESMNAVALEKNLANELDRAFE